MGSRWVRAGLWVVLGGVTGVVAGVVGNLAGGEPAFGRTTWLLGVALGVAFGLAEFWRASRRRRA